MAVARVWGPRRNNVPLYRCVRCGALCSLKLSLPLASPASLSRMRLLRLLSAMTSLRD
jgi:hypothetical protein